jgi:hypothetical protein
MGDARRCRFTRCLMTDGRSIARYYIRQGLFPLALLSTIPWVLLFAVQLPWALATGAPPYVPTIVLQVRATSMLPLMQPHQHRSC